MSGSPAAAGRSPPVGESREGWGGTNEGSHQTVNYMGDRREEYEYRADGSSDERSASPRPTIRTISTAPSLRAACPQGLERPPVRASYARDAMGRVLQISGIRRGSERAPTPLFNIYYDLRGNVEYESTSQLKYESGGAAHLRHQHRQPLRRRRPAQLGRPPPRPGTAPGSKPTSLDFHYAMVGRRAGCRARSTTRTRPAPTRTGSRPIIMTASAGSASVDIYDERRRTVSFAYTPEGQVPQPQGAVSAPPTIRRTSIISSPACRSASSPTMAYDRRSRIDYAQSITQHAGARTRTPAPFRWNTTGGSTARPFGGAGYDYINPGSATAPARRQPLHGARRRHACRRSPPQRLGRSEPVVHDRRGERPRRPASQLVAGQSA